MLQIGRATVWFVQLQIGQSMHDNPGKRTGWTGPVPAYISVLSGLSSLVQTADTMTFSRRQFVKAAALSAVFAEIGAIRSDTLELIKQIEGGDGALVRKDAYSLDPRINYVNHASIGTIPIVVQEAHIRYIRLCETNPWLFMWSEPWQEPREEVRSQLASLFRCSADEIAITHNTTEVFNAVAHGLPLTEGDEVLFSSLNHPGASICWHHRAEEKGFTVRQFDFPIPDVASMTVDDIVGVHVEQIRDNTKVLALPHVDNMIGLRHPLTELSAAARARGVEWIIVDGAQTAGMIPLNLEESGVDVYATSAHKWIQSPKGLGVGYFRKEVQDSIAPMWVTWGQTRWAGSARIFEDYGTRNFAALLAMGDALSFQQNISEGDREKHHVSLWMSMQEMVAAADGLSWKGSTNWETSAALYAIGIESGKSSDAARKLLESSGTITRAFQNDHLDSIRVSPNVMNNVDDLQVVIDNLS